MLKTISEKEYKKLMTLTGDKLDRRIQWFNHTGYATAIEIAGRLHYVLNVRIGRNISEKITVRYTVPLDGEYRTQLERVNS